MQDSDFALAVAEDQRVADVLAIDEFAQGGPLLAEPALACVRHHDQSLGHRLRRRRRRRYADLFRIGEERVGEPRIADGMVAENSNVCRMRETSETIRSTSGMNPMSSMRSASSMTRMRTSFSSSRPRSKTSSNLPGVAMRTSAPR